MKVLLSSVLVLMVCGDLSIIYPYELRLDFESRYSKGLIPSSLGNFGNPPYGTTISGLLILEKDANAKACNPLPALNEDELFGSPIILVERGECPFVKKVRNAQNIGAKAVIIINDNNDDLSKFIMTDNGSGGNLDIPALIISNDDGKILKKYKNENYQIMISLSFTVPISGNGVNLKFWTQSSSVSGMQILTNLSHIVPHLPNLEFTPQFFVWNCKACQDIGYKNENNECIAGGRYCAYDPDGFGPLLGRDVVLEDLREVCVYKAIGKNYSKWFGYIAQFFKKCYQSFTNACAEECMDFVGIDKKLVKICVEESVEGNNILINDNKIMKNETLAWNEDRVPFNPALLINNQLYRGDLEIQAVITAVCAAYSSEYTPKVCKMNYEDVEASDQSHFWIIVLVVGSFLLIIAILILSKLMMDREMKKDLNKQVGAAVAQYFQLSEYTKK